MEEKVIKHVSEKLKKHNLILDEENVKKEYKSLHDAWLENKKNITRPIKFLIIGEATVSYDNYFYNPDAKGTSFLNPNHFNFKYKEDLIDFFKENGVLVFDLYPLPLPTFIYDNIKFDCDDKNYKQALIDHFDQISDIFKVNEEENKLKVILRYSKLSSKKKKRPEWKLFKDHFGINDKEIYSISSSGMSADEHKILEIFARILNNE